VVPLHYQFIIFFELLKKGTKGNKSLLNYQTSSNNYENDILAKCEIHIMTSACIFQDVMYGSGSPPIQKPPISSSFYLDEGHVADIKSNGKEQATSKVIYFSFNLTAHNTEAAVPTETVVEKYSAVEKKSRGPEKPLAKINLQW
jgi:hypothetical protein